MHTPVNQVYDEIALRPVREILFLWRLPKTVVLRGNTKHFHDIQNEHVSGSPQLLSDGPGELELLFESRIRQAHLLDLIAGLLKGMEDVVDVRGHILDDGVVRRYRP